MSAREFLQLLWKRNWFYITSLHDWLKNSRHFFPQSEVKPQPIVICSHAFSSALRQLRLITASFCERWLVHCIVCVLCDWLELLLGFLVLRHSIENRANRRVRMFRFINRNIKSTNCWGTNMILMWCGTMTSLAWQWRVQRWGQIFLVSQQNCCLFLVLFASFPLS